MGYIGGLIMNYSIHTFELTLNLDKENYWKQRNKAKNKSKNNHRFYPDSKRKNVEHDHALADSGIKIEYHNGTYKKKIKFIVNPTKALGGNDVKKLWKPNNDNISKLLCKLEKNIDAYFDSEFQLRDFKLTRIDFTVNIDVGDRKSVTAYIKILHNIGKVKGFVPKYDKSNDMIDTNLSFDKEGQLLNQKAASGQIESLSKLKDAEGILRVEVRLLK